MKYFFEEFQNSMKPPLKVAESKPEPSAKAFYIESLKERDVFTEFHNHHASLVLKDSPCQCTLISKAHKYLQEKRIPTDEIEYNCDCGLMIKVLVPKPTYLEDVTYDVYQELVNGSLDYLYTSKYSVPSIDQLGHGGCMYTGIMKWINNPQAQEVINEIYSEMGFATLGTMSATHTRILLSIFSHCFINADLSFDIFRSILEKFNSNEEEIVYDKNIIDEKDFNPFIE